MQPYANEASDRGPFAKAQRTGRSRRATLHRAACAKAEQVPRKSPDKRQRPNADSLARAPCIRKRARETGLTGGGGWI